jgi:hypothetical protein
LTDEIEIRSSVEQGTEESTFEMEERQEMVETLTKECFKKEGEMDVCKEVNEKVAEQLDPLQVDIDEIQVHADEKRAHIRAREEERTRLKGTSCCALDLHAPRHAVAASHILTPNPPAYTASCVPVPGIFFVSESDANHDLFHFVASALDVCEKQLLATEHEKLIFKAAGNNDQFLGKIISDTLGIVERDALRLPIGTKNLVFSDCLRTVKPRTTPTGQRLAKIQAQTRLLFCEASYSASTHFKEVRCTDILCCGATA